MLTEDARMTVRMLNALTLWKTHSFCILPAVCKTQNHYKGEGTADFLRDYPHKDGNR